MREGSNFPLVIIAGLSGSGKSTALDVYEDLGFMKIDGVPTSLIPSIYTQSLTPEFSEYVGVVIGINLRQEDLVKQFISTLEILHKQEITPYILFLEAKSEVLVHRYASTRRPHPLGKNQLGLEQALVAEKQLLNGLKQLADIVIDTSDYSIHKLRQAIQSKWKAMNVKLDPSLRVHIISFGFKYGAPAEADMIFDLRFLPNPFFEPALKLLSGQDAKVADYVLDTTLGKAFFDRLVDFLSFILTQMEKEGRYRLTIGIGCTGGRHRSVAIAEALTAVVSKDYSTSLEHRHLELG